MEHHHHNHQHHNLPENINRAFIAGIVLNVVFVAIEFFAGFFYESLSLVTDAGHNLSDVGSLAISLAALKLSALKPRKQYTYGFKKTTILASLFNAILLLVVVGAILTEAVNRFSHPVPVPGIPVAIVAFAGILINGITALFFFKAKEKDLNIKGAYLHLLADALVSGGVVIGGLLLYYTGLLWVDALLSVIIAMVILFSTYGLLKDSLRLSLDGVPKNVDMVKVLEAAKSVPGVVAFHHIHIWALSTTENALTAQVVVQPELKEPDIEVIRKALKHQLAHLNIVHCTLEIGREWPDDKNEPCEPFLNDGHFV